MRMISTRLSLPPLFSGSSKAATVPCAGVCGAFPVFGAPLAAVGLWPVAVAMHYLLWVLAPLNVALLWMSFRKHRNPAGLLFGGPGALLLLAAVAVHVLPFDFIPHAAIYPGVALMLIALLLDRRAQRRPIVPELLVGRAAGRAF